jgi:NADH:ubiquinone oxidoreductase subunit 6 (subunit J)
MPRKPQVPWRVFLTCWLVYTVFWTPYIVREHFPAMTLAERCSLNVAPDLGWTEDIFRAPNGGAYINNNPGASLVGAIPLVLLRPLLKSVDDWNQRRPRAIVNGSGEGKTFARMVDEGREFYFLLVAFVTVALVMAPVTAATVAYLCSRLIAAGVPAASAAWAALLCGLGTPMLFRTGYLNHNLLVADAGLVALLLLWDPSNKPLVPARAAAAGLLAGFAFLCDYSGAVVIAVTFVYTWLRSAGQPVSQRWRPLAAFAAGVIPAVAVLAIYQAWAFGAPTRPSQYYMAPTAPTSRGYRGFDWPSPALLWANFFDSRFGLFATCPLLALAFAAPFMTRVRYRIPRREMWILLAYFALFVLFCSANQYSWLQTSTGFRYLVPVVPALAILAVQVGQALPRSVRWLLSGAALAQSVIIAAAHQSDIVLAASALIRNRFELPWMIRLRATGLPVNWLWPLLTFLVLGLALALIWRNPQLRRASAGPADAFRDHEYKDA